MTQRIEQTETPTHVYWVWAFANGTYGAAYQPRNPKTGAPWQGIREITRGQNCHELRNSKTGVNRIVNGALPHRWWRNCPIVDASEWLINGERWTGASNYYRTVEDALAAIAAVKKRSGK